MSKVLLCLGSNKDATHHVEAAKDLLRQVFGAIRFSRSIWTVPVGGCKNSALYLNCLAECDSNMDYATLRQMMKDMERSIGSTPAEREKGTVRIDIDILLAGGLRHHEADWERDYVKSLLSEL